jgi:hypothetical protein
MALIVVVVIGLMFLLAVVSLGRLGISGRFTLLTVEYKLQSEEYAEGCVQVARLYVVNDALFATTSMPVAYKSLACTVVSVEPATPSVGQSRIRAKGVREGATTNFETVVTAADGAVVSWREVATF